MLSASCHCGAIQLRIARAPRTLTECNCSLCRRYGAIWAYHRRRSVQVTYEQRSALAHYCWRKGALEFYHCRRCGCVTHHERARKRSDGGDTLAVNVRNLHQPERIAGLPIRLLDGAESWQVLGERRQPELFRPHGG